MHGCVLACAYENKLFNIRDASELSMGASLHQLAALRVALNPGFPGSRFCLFSKAARQTPEPGKPGFKATLRAPY